MKIDGTILCFVCDKELPNLEYENSLGEKVEVHPMNGLHFQTRGHYGSSIFDPMGTGDTLDLAICDRCILTRLEKVRGSGKREIAEESKMLMEHLNLWEL
jgi:hypothetical protein